MRLSKHTRNFRFHVVNIDSLYIDSQGNAYCYRPVYYSNWKFDTEQLDEVVYRVLTNINPMEDVMQQKLDMHYYFYKFAGLKYTGEYFNSGIIKIPHLSPFGSGKRRVWIDDYDYVESNYITFLDLEDVKQIIH